MHAGLTKAYFVHKSSRGWVYSKRTSHYHKHVFHGSSYYVEDTGPMWPHPRLSNSNRALIHLSRSGAFVPPVFTPWVSDMIVSEAVRDGLSQFRGIEFQKVIFEQLYDIVMPAVGDSEYSELREHEVREMFSHLPHCPTMASEIGEYYRILAPSFVDMAKELPDPLRMKPEFSNYAGYVGRVVSFSEQLLDAHPIYHAESGNFVFREDAFEVIAPFLDLDYFSIAYHSLRPKVHVDLNGVHLPETK